MGAAGQASGYEIDQSIRFNDLDSAFLARTPSASNRKTWTWSAWVKRSNLFNGSVPQILLSAGDGGANDFVMQFGQSDDTLRISDYISGTASNLITTQLFRDVGAWYHFVLVYDTTQGTAANRIKLYVNGSQVTAFGTETNPSLNADLVINSAIPHNIGRGAYSSNGYFSGYIAEINFVDGTALAPTAFGETNDDGVWIPIKYAGSYGTEGYFIDGRDSSDLGDDESGNGNDFASSGLTAADQMLDTPTLNYCTMNILDNGRPANITVSDGNLTCAFAGAGYNGGIRSSFFFDSEDSDGWYAECTLDSLAVASVFRAGVSNASLNLASNDAQTSADGWAYSDQGAKLNNSYTTGYGSAVTTTDVVGIAVRNGKIYFAVNNVWQGSADPVTESNPAFSNLLGDVAFCQSTNTGGSYAHTATWNFGQSGFAYTPPTGYKAVNTANLATPSITDGSAYFQPTIYTGNGSTLEVNQSGNSTFQPDWVWGKRRNGAESHALFDAVRGTTKIIYSNLTNAETTNSGLTAFDADGFTIGSSATLNTNTGTYVAWQWKANGAGSSNEDGSINTTATSANTTAGFSVSTFTGTGANATVGHGLGIAPSLVIIKSRNDTHDWYVRTPALSGTEFLVLNTTAAKGTASPEVWNSTVPTSSVVNIGTSIGVNRNTYNYVMYCFAEIPGYSSFGSYTGNGSTDGAFVYTGFSPAFIMYKVTSTTDSWEMYDTTRQTSNVYGTQLKANLSNAETDDTRIDILSNGFKARSTNTAVNASGATYIYMAFAENPFGGEDIAPATAR